MLTSWTRRFRLGHRNISEMPTMMRAVALTLSVSASLARCQYPPTGPTARVKNGTLLGVHSDIYNQDFFLGIPYAQPPVGNLRYRAPASLNQSWFDARPATANSAEVYNGINIHISLANMLQVLWLWIRPVELPCFRGLSLSECRSPFWIRT
jgi:hypothetical protein